MARILHLLWLWHKLAAIALIPPLAWEPPYAVDSALKKKNHYTYEENQQHER